MHPTVIMLLTIRNDEGTADTTGRALGTKSCGTSICEFLHNGARVLGEATKAQNSLFWPRISHEIWTVLRTQTGPADASACDPTLGLFLPFTVCKEFLCRWSIVFRVWTGARKREDEGRRRCILKAPRTRCRSRDGLGEGQGIWTLKSFVRLPSGSRAEPRRKTDIRVVHIFPVRRPLVAYKTLYAFCYPIIFIYHDVWSEMTHLPIRLSWPGRIGVRGTYPSSLVQPWLCYWT